MKKDRFHFKLGLFTLAGIALATFAVVYLGGIRWHRQSFTVETYFDQSVSGLSVGAPVRHRGVDVGRVTKIDFVTSKYRVPPGSTGEGHRNFNMANLILVEMSIDREAVRPLDDPNGNERTAVDAMVNDGLRLRLSSSLLGGGGYIDADFIDADGRAVPPVVPWTPNDIYIPSQPSPTNRLIENLDRIAAEIQRSHPGDLINHIDALVGDATRLTNGLDTKQLQDRATVLLDNLNQATASLEKILDDPHIASILTDTSVTAANVKGLTDPKTSELAKLLGDVRQAAAQLNKLLNDPALKEAIANTGPLTADARKLANRLSELVAGEREDLVDMIRSLRATVANIESITSDAKDNPARIIFGAPPPKIVIQTTPEKQR